MLLLETWLYGTLPLRRTSFHPVSTLRGRRACVRFTSQATRTAFLCSRLARVSMHELPKTVQTVVRCLRMAAGKTQRIPQLSRTPHRIIRTRTDSTARDNRRPSVDAADRRSGVGSHTVGFERMRRFQSLRLFDRRQSKPDQSDDSFQHCLSMGTTGQRQGIHDRLFTPIGRVCFLAVSLTGYLMCCAVAVAEGRRAAQVRTTEVSCPSYFETTPNRRAC